LTTGVNFSPERYGKIFVVEKKRDLAPFNFDEYLDDISSILK